MRRTFYEIASASIFIGLVILTLSSNVQAQGEGDKLFKTNCVLCHDADGSGSSTAGKALGAKDLRSREVQEKSDTELSEVITQGKDKMPAFGKKLKPEDIKLLMAYIRGIATKK